MWKDHKDVHIFNAYVKVMHFVNGRRYEYVSKTEHIHLLPIKYTIYIY